MTAAETTEHLVSRTPRVSGTEMASYLVPPRQFEGSTLENYRPDPDHPSQGEALEAMRAFASGWSAPTGGGWFRRAKRPPVGKPGVYLDGGFGVGKTHLLAALWHLAPGRKYFGTFIEYTALVGALGYRDTVDLLSGATLVSIDEFELDDPGDTMVMTRLLGELVASGSRVAATSNTPPNALGEGRFAASDFLREIHAMSANFDVIRIDGLDYRRRDSVGSAGIVAAGEVAAATAAAAGSDRWTVDSFADVLEHLAKVHPSRYVKLVEGLGAVGFEDVQPFASQTDALRFVALVDRLYDAQVRVIASGTPLDQVFAEDMLAGGYRKKYLRAISRLVALTN
ncbi:MAG: cell division protein ZapE [Naasia sp.]|uniref:cell division protein ZapE n=1 Tax=Naasia sp. TaxID=2546198 RepID=UPI00260210B0|nr:cell division protein ZapE [Naasia sp.]MCU1571178.1 cell division protein ZapE [Naasia sp.]